MQLTETAIFVPVSCTFKRNGTETKRQLLFDHKPTPTTTLVRKTLVYRLSDCTSMYIHFVHVHTVVVDVSNHVQGPSHLLKPGQLAVSATHRMYSFYPLGGRVKPLQGAKYKPLVNYIVS